MKAFFIFSLILNTSLYAESLEKCKPLEVLIEKINDNKRFNYSSVNKMIILSDSSKCDKGHYANSISKIVVQALANDFVRTVKVASKNYNSLSFVVTHIDSKKESSDLAKITDNALKICPSEKKAVCTKIEHATRIAMKGIHLN